LSDHVQTAASGRGWCALNRRTVIDSEIGSRHVDLPQSITLDRAILKEAGSNWRSIKLEALNESGPFPQEAGLVDVPVVMVGTRGRGHTLPLSQESLRFLGNADTEFVKSFDERGVRRSAKKDVSRELGRGSPSDSP
jgi:hypothetical protein